MLEKRIDAKKMNAVTVIKSFYVFVILFNKCISLILFGDNNFQREFLYYV